MKKSLSVLGSVYSLLRHLLPKQTILVDIAAAAAKSLQSCPTLCDLIDGSPPGSPVPGILQQEHWSRLPLPSPMHESKKLK